MSALTVGMGHQTLVGIGEETTFGTPVTRTLGLRVIEAGLALKQQTIQKSVLGHSSKHVNIAGKRAVEGGLKLLFPAEGAAIKMLAKHGFGAISSPAGTLMDDAVTTLTTHTFSLTDALPEAGLSIETDADNGNTGEAFLFASCKANKFSLAQAIDDALMLDIAYLGQQKTEVSATGGLTYQSLKTFDWDDLVVTLGGQAIDVESFEFNLENNLDGDSYKLGSLLRKNIRRKDTRSVSGKIEMELESDDIEDFFNAFTENTLTAVWTGPQVGLISGVAQYRKLTLSMPRVILQGGFDGVKDSGRIKLSVPFICSPTLDTDASEVTLTHINTTA